ncbi:hypothetical protein Tco_0104431 [Tanacetum coccineum]
MQRPPLFEANYFIYWKNRFETYVKSKDIDLWHIIVYDDYKPTIKKMDTEKDEVIPYEKYEESHKKMISKNDEAKMVLYNALPKKEYERFMCKTTKDVWNSLIITHQGSAREGFEASKIRRKINKISCSIKQGKRRGKFVCQPHEDKKSFRKVKEEKKGKEDQRCFKCGDPNHFISNYPKLSFNDQKAFVGGFWSESDEEDESKRDEICLMALSNNEVLSDTPYYSSSYLDSESLQNEYNKLCKISLRIINKNKHLKAKNELLKNEARDHRKRLARKEQRDLCQM